VWATILAVDATGSWTWQRIAGVTALGFAAMAYRVAGVALVPALALYALATWRQNRSKPLVPVAIWIGSGLVVIALSAIELPFADLLIPRISEIAERARHALTVYPVAALSAQLYPFAGNRANDTYHVVASIAMIIGVLVLLWRLRRTMLATFTVAYSAMLFASPAINDRYLWPLLPVLVSGLVITVNAVWKAITTPLGWRSRGPVLAAATMALIATAASARESTRPAFPSDHGDPNREALFAWLRETHAREPMRVVYANPRVLTLETRVPAMPPLFAKPNHHVSAFYDRDISHMVWPRVTPNDCRARLAHELVQIYPDRFELAYENPGYRVYRVLRPDGPIPPVENYRPAWGGDRCNPGRPDLDPDTQR
jgi:hypothetical protein